MDTIISKGQSQSSCQQGYVLALTLILMLFASLILVSSIERTSVETRIAASELHRATLEAAAEQGVHHFRRAVDFHIEPSKPPIKNCELIADLIAKEGLANLFDIDEKLDEKLKGPGSEQTPVDFLDEKGLREAGWWVNLIQDATQTLCHVTENESASLGFASYSLIGSITAPQANLVLSANINFEDDFQGDGLDRIFGNRAAQAAETLRVDSGGEVKGHAAAHRLEIDGGGRFEAEDLELGYSELDIPSWYDSNPPDWYKDVEVPDENYSSPKPDPLGLIEWRDEAIYRVDDDALDPLPTVGMMSLSDEFANIYNAREVGQYPFEQLRIRPTEDSMQVQVFDSRDKVNDWVTVSGKPPIGYYPSISPSLATLLENDEQNSSILVLDDLTLRAGGKSPSILVDGGDVNLYIEGDVSFAGGTSIRITPNSSLTLVVNGVTDIGSGFKLKVDEDKSRNIEGQRYFTLLSVNDSQDSVIIRSDSRIYGSIYSLGDISLLEGGSVQGQVHGRNILVTGGTGVDSTNAQAGDGTRISPEFDLDY